MEFNTEKQNLFSCETCSKPYKTVNGLKNHKCKYQRGDIKLQPPPTKKRKKKISPQIRFDVWKTYIGNMIEGKCFCCWNNKITPFTYCNTFHAGHIKSEANGGEITIGNLLPICSDCNSSMGALNWDEYIQIYTNFRIRIFGNNIPKKATNKAILIQKYYKKYKQNKKRHVLKKKKKCKYKLPNYLKPTISSLKKISLKRIE